MVAPDCNRCGSTLENWQGNIMVNKTIYINEHRITNLEVWCKACTRRLDDAGVGRTYHNLWELTWIRDEPMSRLGSVLQDTMQEHDFTTKWDKEAIREIGFLVALTMEYDEAESFLRYLNWAEWDNPGEYRQALAAKHGKEVDE